MKTDDIIIELIKLRNNKDFDGIDKLFNSLNSTELGKLQNFSIELKYYCEMMIKKQL